MNNNIPNMNGANPVGYNPQNPKPIQGQEALNAPLEPNQPLNQDPLKYVPGDQYGRAMINQTQGVNTAAPQINPQNIQEDMFTFKLMQEFGNELYQGYIQKGIDPQSAWQMTDTTLSILLYPPQAFMNPEQTSKPY